MVKQPSYRTAGFHCIPGSGGTSTSMDLFKTLQRLNCTSAAARACPVVGDTDDEDVDNGEHLGRLFTGAKHLAEAKKMFCAVSAHPRKQQRDPERSRRSFGTSTSTSSHYPMRQASFSVFVYEGEGEEYEHDDGYEAEDVTSRVTSATSCANSTRNSSRTKNCLDNEYILPATPTQATSSASPVAAAASSRQSRPQVTPTTATALQDSLLLPQMQERYRLVKQTGHKACNHRGAPFPVKLQPPPGKPKPNLASRKPDMVAPLRIATDASGVRVSPLSSVAADDEALPFDDRIYTYSPFPEERAGVGKQAAEAAAISAEDSELRKCQPNANDVVLEFPPNQRRRMHLNGGSPKLVDTLFRADLAPEREDHSFRKAPRVDVTWTTATTATQDSSLSFVEGMNQSELSRSSTDGAPASLFELDKSRSTLSWMLDPTDSSDNDGEDPELSFFTADKDSEEVKERDEFSPFTPEAKYNDEGGSPMMIYQTLTYDASVSSPLSWLLQAKRVFLPPSFDASNTDKPGPTSTTSTVATTSSTATASLCALPYEERLALRLQKKKTLSLHVRSTSSATHRSNDATTTTTMSTRSMLDEASAPAIRRVSADAVVPNQDIWRSLY
jgi:hypothetical protein